MDEASGGFGKLGTVAAGAGVAVGAALTAIGVKGVANIAKLESQLSEVRTLLPDLSDQGFAKLRDDVLAFSSEMNVATDEAVPALYQAISAGVPAENVIEFMKTATAAAVGGVTDLETAVDGITSVVNSYGEDVVGAAEASDLMFTAVKLGKTDFEQLSSSLFNVVPIASSMGVQFKEVTAAMAVMTAQGVPTSVATTQLRAAITELTKVGSDGSTVLQSSLGKTLQELQGEGHSFGDVLQMMRGELGDVGFQSAFGSVEAYQAALALTGKNAEKFASALGDMETSQGATQAAFETMSDTLEFKWEKVMNRVNNLLTEVGVQLMPVVIAALDAAIPVIDSLAEFLSTKAIPAIRTFIEWLRETAIAIQPIVLAISVGLLPVLEALGAAWKVIWEEVGAVFKQVMAELGPEFEALGETGIEWSDVMSTAVTVMLTAIQVAVPLVVASIQTIGNVIITLVKVGAEVISFFQNVFKGDWEAAWQDVTDIGSILMEGIVRQAEIFFGAIKAVADVFGIDIVAVFTTISDAITGPFVSAINTVKDIWSGALNAMNAVLQKVWSGTSIQPVLQAWVDFLTITLTGAVTSFRDLWGEAMTAINSALQAVWGIFSPIFEGIRNAVQAAWDFVNPIFQQIIGILIGEDGSGILGSVERMRMVFMLALSIISRTAATYIGNIVHTFRLIVAVGSEVIDFVKNVFSGNWSEAWQNVQDIFQAFVDYITDRIASIVDLVKDIAAVFGVDLQPAIEAFQGVWQGVMGALGAAWDTFTGLFTPGAEGMNETISAFTPVIEALRDAWEEIWGTIQDEFAAVWAELEPLFTELKETFDALFGKLFGYIDTIDVEMPAMQAVIQTVIDAIVLAIEIATPIIVGLIEAIGLAIRTIVTIVTEVIDFFQNVFAGDWEAAWGNIQNIGQTAVDYITGMLKIWIGIVTGIAEAFGIDLPAIFTSMWDAIVGKFKSAAMSISSWIGTIRSVIDSIISKIDSFIGKVSGVKDAASTVSSAVGGFAGGIKDKVGGFLGNRKDGGYIPPTPGGSMVRVGEAGEGEWIVPESHTRGGVPSMGGSGGNTYQITLSSPFQPTTEQLNYLYSLIEKLEGRGSLVKVTS